jgi:ArsR family transcriptional regulator, arsenate/arsenite/antimonite-responsive transcriptional repressor
MSGKVKKFAIEKLFSALADRTRLRLLNLMADGEVCVCFFVEVLQQNQPKISRHLAYLRNAGVVAARREGKWMHYSIVEPSDPYAARIFNEVQTWLAEDSEMKHDRERLEQVCCGVKVPFTLQYAPQPSAIAVQSQSIALQEEPPVPEVTEQLAHKSNSFQDTNWLDYD